MPDSIRQKPAAKKGKIAAVTPIVVMDIVLSGKVDGITAAQELQPLGIPIVYLTAYSDRHLLERAQHTEPLGYVIKPARSEELAAVIKLALFKREKEQERDRQGQQRAVAYREADEQFRLIVAGVTDLAIFTLDVSGNVNSWNHGAEKSTATVPKTLSVSHSPSFLRRRIAGKAFLKWNSNAPNRTDQWITRAGWSAVTGNATGQRVFSRLSAMRKAR
jgi:CheY-like chemotaxis protein